MMLPQYIMEGSLEKSLIMQTGVQIPTRWPLTKHLTSRSLTFFNYKMENLIPALQSCGN